jgi:hypothetical protein
MSLNTSSAECRSGECHCVKCRGTNLVALDINEMTFMLHYQILNLKLDGKILSQLSNNCKQDRHSGRALKD